MREIKVVCDICENEMDEGKGYIVPMSEGFESDCLDICPRCMAIVRDEVWKRVKQ